MLFDNNKISLRQLQILIITNNLVLGLITLPKLFSGGLIINNLVLLFFIILTTQLILSATKKELNQNMSHNIVCQEENSFETNHRANLNSKILFWPLLIKIIVSTGLELKSFTHIVETYVLRDTSKFIISIILVLTALYLVFKGYETRTRLCEILIWPIILPMAIIFFLSLFNINLSSQDLKRMLLDNNITHLEPKKIFYSMFVFSQLDYLYLVNAFIGNKDHKLKQKKILQAIFFTWLGIFFVINTIKLIIHAKGPFLIIKSINTIDMPSNFIQNQDFFITSFIIISFFILITGGLFFSKFLATSLFSEKLNKSLVPIIIILAAVFLVFMTPENISWLIVYVLGSFYYFLLPIILLISGGDKKAGELK